jgi:hypothetical protein
MKLDAHCAMDQGFDKKMLKGFKISGDNVVMLPVMRNLHVFDWVCPRDGERLYQDKVPRCPKCEGDMEREMMWIPKTNPQSASYCFDSTPQFKYFGDYTKRPEYAEDKKKYKNTQTMSIQGSCFMCTRKLYDKLNLCDESFGSWGNQGIEVACKVWLSGGRVLANHRTWYAHLFRTKANFMFPWPVSGNAQSKTKKKVRDAVYGGKLPHQKRPVSWLVEKFWPVKGWKQKDLDNLKKQENASIRPE